LVFFKEKFNPKLIIRLSQNNLKKLDEWMVDIPIYLADRIFELL
jgi:hypothetical protein